MKITKIDTIMAPEHPHMMWVQIHTDEGITGLGETRPRPTSVRRLIHDILSGMLIGKDPTNIEALWNDMFRALSYHGWAGTEIRGISVIDIALWDILGKVCGQPLYKLLGGKCRETVPIYNTCVGFGTYDDRNRFLSDPASLAEELLDEGIQGMKVWPFDEASAATKGNFIALDDLKKGVAVFEKIRCAVGDKMDVALEGHGCWNLPTGIKIAQALQPYKLWWLEDLIPADNIGALQQLRASTDTPLCVSERLYTRYQCLPLMERQAADIIISDVCWVGGITELKKVAAIASAYQLPIAPHNCGGPVQMHVSGQIAVNLPNLMTLETVRAFYRSYYDKIVTNVPRIEAGFLHVSELPGIGTELSKDFLSREDLSIEVSEGELFIPWASGDPWKKK